MSIPPATFALGFHSQNQADQVFGTNSRGGSKQDAWAFNAWNTIGYFPLIGTIMGIRKLHVQHTAAYVRTDFGPSLTRAFTARWIVETLSLGALFIIPDLIVSIGRAILAPSKPHAKAESILKPRAPKYVRV